MGTPDQNATNANGYVQVQLICTAKTYEFVHGAAALQGRAETNVSTLNGLYSPKGVVDSEGDSDGNQEPTSAPKNALSSEKVQITTGDLSDNQRNALSRAIASLPPILGKQFGVTDITQKRDTFHRMVQKAKAYLQKTAAANGGIVPISEMKQAEEKMLPYNCRGYNLQIKCDRYTKAKVAGSRLDKQTGLYKISRVVRSYYIDKMMTQEQLQKLANALAKEALKDETVVMQTTAGFQVSRNPKTGSVTFTPITRRRFQ